MPDSEMSYHEDTDQDALSLGDSAEDTGLEGMEDQHRETVRLSSTDSLQVTPNC
jgi:hypothetical protein